MWKHEKGAVLHLVSERAHHQVWPLREPHESLCWARDLQTRTHGSPPFRIPMMRLAQRVFSNAYLALGAGPQASKDAKEARLAASVWSSHKHTLPPPHRQAQILDQQSVCPSSFRVHLIKRRRHGHSIKSDGVAPFLAYPCAQGSRADTCTKISGIGRYQIMGDDRKCWVLRGAKYWVHCEEANAGYLLGASFLDKSASKSWTIRPVKPCSSSTLRPI